MVRSTIQAVTENMNHHDTLREHVFCLIGIQQVSCMHRIHHIIHHIQATQVPSYIQFCSCGCKGLRNAVIPTEMQCTELTPLVSLCLWTFLYLFPLSLKVFNNAS